LRALVIKSTGSWYKLKIEDGSILNARIKGKIRLKELRVTNPVAVGDFVDYELEDSGDVTEGVILNVCKRHNYIIRKSNKLSKHGQIIATNIDMALLIATISHPETSLGFIDRFLLMASAFHIPTTIVFNKVDLYSENELAYCNHLSELYSSLGHPCIKTSLNLAEFEPTKMLNEVIKNKKVLISGHSGVGKSSIINAFLPNAKQKVDIINMHFKGKHTTTFAEMFFVDDNTAIIDTPGIRDFGVIDIPQQEIAHYFPEMRALMSKCKFNNCIHLNEPECAVYEAFERNEIAPSRYQSYLSILDNENMFG